MTCITCKEGNDMQAVKKRLFSLFLVITMVFSVFQAAPAVYAEELPEEPEAPEEILSEETELPEEQPEETETPEVITEPEEPEAPEVIAEPEETEAPEPEETMAPEPAEEEPQIPEETAVPAEEEPEPVGETDEITDALEEDPADLTELMSEPIGSHQTVEDASRLEIGNVEWQSQYGVSIAVTAMWKTSVPVFVYLIAENKTTRYFLDSYEMPPSNTPFYYEGVIPGIPAGVYDLRLAVTDTTFEQPTLRVSPAYSKKLRILPAPDVKVAKPDDGSYNGEFQVKLPSLTGIDGLGVLRSSNNTLAEYDITEIRAKAKNGQFTVGGIPADEEPYYFFYGGAETADELRVGKYSQLTMPRTVAPSTLNAWVKKDGVFYGNSSNPIVLKYKGETVQIGHELQTYETSDVRLNYKSQNTKVATVDAAGNIKAVAKGTTVIKVTSAADSAVYADIYVTVDPVTIKTFAFNVKKGTPAAGRSSVISPKQNIEGGTAPKYSLIVNTDQAAAEAEVPVTFTVSGGDGLKIYSGSGSEDNFANYVSVYKTNINKLTHSKQITLMASGAGHYTVKAESLGKTATCTVDVDGFSKVSGSEADPADDAAFWKAGKQVTGWIAWDGDNFITGSAAIKTGAHGLAGRRIYYVDPSKKVPAEAGVHKIGKKFYAFESDHRLLLAYDSGYENSVKGFKWAYNPLRGEDDIVCINKDGSLLTGWQLTEASGEVYYLDPATGFAKRNAWVPVRSGSGETWVNGDGLLRDDNGNSLDNLGAMEVDGIHEINGSLYIFAGGYKKSAKKTGWVYLKKEGGAFVTADSKTAEVKVYADPYTYNGMVRGGTFTVSGKTYEGEDLTSEGLFCYVPIPGTYVKATYGVTGAKYLLNGYYHIIGPDGSLVKNKLVDVYNPYYYGKIIKMYAQDDGMPAYDRWVKVGGVNLYFDDEGVLSQTTELTNTNFYVGKGSTFVPVTAKFTSIKAGYKYYADSKELKSILLYSKGESANYYPSAVLDKNGKLVTKGPAKAKPAPGAAVTNTYLVDDNGYLCIGYADFNEKFKVGGKWYAVDDEACVQTAQGLVRLGDSGDSNFGYVGKNGVLVHDAFATATVGGEKRKLYFTSYGEMAKGSEMSEGGVIAVGKKYYITEKVYDPIFGEYLTPVVIPAKAGWYSVFDGVYLNKDGTVKTGILTRPDGTIICVEMRPYGLKVLRADEGNGSPVIWKKDSRYYLFNDDKVMITGWIWFDNAVFKDAYTDQILNEKAGLLMYFDPKTGAAAAGGWKTVPVPEVIEYDVDEGYEPARGHEDIGIAEQSGFVTFAGNSSGKNAKLYFDEYGDLSRSIEIRIGNRTYMFGPDGRTETRTGWADANKLSYVTKNGTLATGRVKIDGQYYHFDDNGCIDTNSLRKTGSKWYYYGRTGAQETPVLSTAAEDFVLCGSPNHTELTAVWAKDGSLTKIVYTGSGKPAAGELVNFGDFDPDYDIFTSFILDSNGLPKTGAVYGITEDSYSRAYLYNKDGSKFGSGYGGYSSMVSFGGKYYVVDLNEVQTQTETAAVVIYGGWDDLNAKDRKAMDFYAEVGANYSDDLYVIVNPDGSAAVNQEVYASIDGEERVWHTNRLGIPMEMYTPIYKFGGKWYTDDMSGEISLHAPGGPVKAQIRVKNNGELIGFYDCDTGKPINGVYSSEAWIISLKKGKPQTGTIITGFNETYYLDPQCGVYRVHP